MKNLERFVTVSNIAVSLEIVILITKINNYILHVRAYLYNSERKSYKYLI